MNANGIWPLGLRLILVSLLLSAIPATTRATPPAAKTYPLTSWKNLSCRAKGRMQDRDYCSSKVMDQIVADGKPAIPVLISQITDSRMIAEPVYDFWPRIETGALAHFILSDLFVDETWQKSTMPDLFPNQKCDQPGWVCWANFRKTHSLQQIQSHWRTFWLANQDKIYWDDKSRCFRLIPK